MAHILVIDDDTVVLSLVSGILETHGHTVAVAQDGRAGMKIFGEGRVDLVITDIVMAGQEGIATIGALRRASPKVPILAMSGSNTVGRYGSYLDAAVLLGANATLSKPITIDGLMQVVDRLLAPQSAGDAAAHGA